MQLVLQWHTCSRVVVNTKSETVNAVAFHISLRVCREPSLDHFIILLWTSHLKNRTAAGLWAVSSAPWSCRLGYVSKRIAWIAYIHVNFVLCWPRAGFISGCQLVLFILIWRSGCCWSFLWVTWHKIWLEMINQMSQMKSQVRMLDECVRIHYPFF